MDTGCCQARPLAGRFTIRGGNEQRKIFRMSRKKIEQFAELLCWKKISEKDGIAIWRKRLNDKSCSMKQDKPKIGKCELANDNDVW